MVELLRPALTTFFRTGLFLTLGAWCITQWWIIEWTGMVFNRPVAVTVYQHGAIVADIGLEALPSQWTIRRLTADFNPRAPVRGETMVQAISPVPGTAFLWSGDTVLGFRHQFVVAAFAIMTVLLAINRRNTLRSRRSLQAKTPSATLPQAKVGHASSKAAVARNVQNAWLA
ncbi:MAG: hypothetical protein Fues2KO_48330 [Fuerstiella sp.]